MTEPKPQSPPQAQSHLGLLVAAFFLGGCEAELSAPPEVDTRANPTEGSPSDPPATAPTDPASLPVVGEGLHRLNRLEYRRTLSDLLYVDVIAPDFLPPDPALSGFDNMAEGLLLSPSLFDLYFTAARDAVEAAVNTTPLFQTALTPSSGAPSGIPVGNEAWALHGETWSAEVSVPQSGSYRISVALSGTRTGAAPVPTYTLEVDGAAEPDSAISGSPAAPELLELPVDWTSGTHTLRVIPTNFVNIGVENTNNEVIIHAFEVRSVEETRSDPFDILVPCELTAPECGAESVVGFASRAFRRPLTVDERQRLLSLHTRLLETEESLDALKLAFRAILVSPEFLYRALRLDDVEGDLVGAYYLASKLSYFLWSTMPDEMLFEAAASGALLEEDGLRAQVVRMLDSPRSDGLLQGFAEQWLGLRALDQASPSEEIFPGFSEALREDITLESLAFFSALLQEDIDLGSLLNPGLGFLNDRLAAHYALPPPGSSDVGATRLEADQRQGLLELGAWLVAQSEPEATSPIRRGRWVLEQFLCVPVPPPPPDVVAVLPDVEGLSVRERLEVHRSDPSCSGCHQLLDPIGLGFETYDAVGSPRLESSEPVDASGELPSGATFDGPRELSTTLAPTNEVGLCLAEKLLSYALSHPLGTSEKPLSHALFAQSGGPEATLRDLLTEIALSPQFRAMPPNWDF